MTTTQYGSMVYTILPSSCTTSCKRAGSLKQPRTHRTLRWEDEFYMNTHCQSLVNPSCTTTILNHYCTTIQPNCYTSIHVYTSSVLLLPLHYSAANRRLTRVSRPRRSGCTTSCPRVGSPGKSPTRRAGRTCAERPPSSSHPRRPDYGSVCSV